MKLQTTLLALVAAVIAAPSSIIERRSPAAYSTFTHNPVYYPLQQAPLWRTAYARALQLSDKSLIATWEDYPYGESSSNLDTFKIIRSTDGGATWANLSQVVDTQNGWGMRFQPHLYTLTSAVGSFPAGTILISGVSTPLSLKGGVYIDVYYSKDSGKTWSFASHVAYGQGPETTTTGHAAIWEPFFLQYNGKLYVYFSDQRDSAHSQKLSLTYTTDLKSWSASTDVVTYSDSNARPGMAVVSYLPTVNQYILTYEYCNAPEGGCPAYYKLSADPTAFNSIPGTRVQTSDGSNPGGSPYTVWNQYPNSNSGSIILSGNGDTSFYASKDNAKTWTKVDKDQYTGQSRHLMIFNDNGVQRLHSITGGFYGCQGSCYNYVANGVSDLTGF